MRVTAALLHCCFSAREEFQISCSCLYTRVSLGYQNVLILVSSSGSVDTEFLSRAEGTRVSQKGPLDGAGDPPSFSAGVVDPAHSSLDVPVNLTL